MGMNTILTLIVGIVMTTMVGTQVAPSIIDQIKVKKTQVQTINNQEVIFEAIKRYTTLKQVAPTSIQDLINEGYLEANVNNNGNNPGKILLIISCKTNGLFPLPKFNTTGVESFT